MKAIKLAICTLFFFSACELPEPKKNQTDNGPNQPTIEVKVAEYPVDIENCSDWGNCFGYDFSEAERLKNIDSIETFVVREKNGAIDVIQSVSEIDWDVFQNVLESSHLVLPLKREMKQADILRILDWLSTFPTNGPVILYNSTTTDFDPDFKDKFRLIDIHSSCDSMRMEAFNQKVIDLQRLKLLREQNMVPIFDYQEGMYVQAVFPCDN